MAQDDILIRYKVDTTDLDKASVAFADVTAETKQLQTQIKATFSDKSIEQATKDLYEQGFGSRLKVKIDELKNEIIKEDIKLEKAVFPIDIFPTDIQFYINECSTKLDSNIEFMGVSLIWLISVCVGNSLQVEVKRGWNENGVVWIATVGKAGLGKTPSIHNIISPLQTANSKEIKR